MAAYNPIKFHFLIIILLVFIETEAQSSALKTADNFYALGNYSEAIKNYEKIIPKDQYIFLQIAKAHKAKGTYLNALTYYEKAVISNPSLSSAKLEYAKLLMTTNKIQKADSVYSELVLQHDKNPNFQYRLGLAKKKLKDSTAITYFEEAFRLDSTHQKSCFEVAMYYLKKRKYNKVFDTANKGLASYPENPELINVLGQNYLLRQYYEEAIPYFEKLISLGYSNEFIHASLALCYHKNYDYELAIPQYQEALNYNDKIPIRYTRLAEAYTAVKNYEMALDSYRAAIALKDLPIEEDLLNIAMMYRHQKQWEKAIQQAKVALKENPNYARAQYQLAAFADAYYKDPQVKLDYYNVFIKKFGEDTSKKNYFNFIVKRRIAQLEEEIETSKKKAEKK
ncbi:tetratricopeptide repeat protein [Aquimarina sp. 2201CG14-23]|uniref:tetratricopeptide repeat protein n=1 Tax=Aquimarina mycalae TaxID=3040073 RepID=UPI002477DB19|nr:tetratricopeptide repeat protein [Aquimarina sp. 2201CG14-23]MDH7448005.1 tetratricopeptide repeat protein [Aquimarina sp. 2201CG14-23]